MAGVGVSWAAVLPPARTVELPTYAFDHQRYWLTFPSPGATPAPAAKDGQDSDAAVAPWRYTVTWVPAATPASAFSVT